MARPSPIRSRGLRPIGTLARYTLDGRESIPHLSASASPPFAETAANPDPSVGRPAAAVNSDVAAGDFASSGLSSRNPAAFSAACASGLDMNVFQTNPL